MTRIEVAYATDKGRKREGNEDAFVALLPPTTPAGVDAVLAVADGMGGHQAGEVASALAVRMVADRLGTRGEGATLVGGDASPYPVALRRIAEDANAEIVANAQGERRGMGSTLTLSLFQGRSLHLAHVGDSRAYLLRGGELRLLTQDHSWVMEQVRAGLLAPEAAATHPRRNVLTRALGAAQTVESQTETVPLEEDDLVLLCSDGLHGVLRDDEIAAALRNAKGLQAACNTLIELANAGGGPDNITVLLARVGDRAASRTPAATSATTQVPKAAPRQEKAGGRRALLLIVAFLVLLLLAGLVVAWVLFGESLLKIMG